ncbi:MAG: hypothetical protein WCK21_05365 [Actinomycetota bacterium]
MKLTRLSLLVTTVVIGLIVPLPSAHAGGGGARGGQATFEGRTIDLSVDWQGATACNIAPSGSVCFRTEAQLDQFLSTATVDTTATVDSLASSCSSTLRLYSGTSYTGSVLNLSTEFLFINLSTYGFDNITSSYKVGACDTWFYSGASGGGSLYPGSTSAFSSSTSMLFGWNDVISSVYIS